MKIEQTRTWSDIKETPELLEKFSRDYSGKLKDNALKSADESVYLVGRGSSDNATLFAKYIWEKYTGVRADFVRPHSVFEAGIPLNYKNKVVWAFSQSGKSADVVECLKKVISWGAKGVAVTNEPDLSRNPLAKTTHKHILLSESKENVVAATKTFALQLWLAFWTAQSWNECFKTEDFSETVRLIKGFLEQPELFTPKGRFTFWRDLKRAGGIAFVGRGALSAVAADAALKFREMAGLHAAAYSAAEFLHGPIGAHGRKDLVFLLSPSSGRLPEDLSKVALALKERGTVYHSISPAGGKPPFNAMLTDIELKIAALRLAVEKGLNPDQPAGLKKITETI